MTPTKTKPIQKPDGTIILPGKDGNTGTDDDIIVKPNGDKPAGRIDEDGNVTITAPDGADVTIPATIRQTLRCRPARSSPRTVRLRWYTPFSM